MRRWSLLESYALLVCLITVICFFVALYYLGLGIVAREAPEYTINRWAYGYHQTNERYWQHASVGNRRSRPSEDVLTAERERSWRAEQQLARRDGTRITWLSTVGVVVSSVVFWGHWRVARRAKREERGNESDRIHRPLVLASVIVFGLSSCFCSGLLGGLAVSAVGGNSWRFVEESRAMVPILADPAFAEVEIRERSDGGIYLSGVLSTEADLERLRVQTARVLGEQRGEDATRGVQVRLAAPPAR